MARFYANENFPLAVVSSLRDLGHDVITTQESGFGGLSLSDENVLAFAVEHQRVVLTFNRKHFVRLHLANQSHTGIVVCTFDPDFVALAARIDTAVRAHSDVRHQLIRINRPNETL